VSADGVYRECAAMSRHHREPGNGHLLASFIMEVPVAPSIQARGHAFVILNLGRHEVVRTGVPCAPSAEYAAQSFVEGTKSRASLSEHRIGRLCVLPTAARNATARWPRQARDSTRRSRRGGFRPPAACGDHGSQAIILGRIQPCVTEKSLARWSDGVFAVLAVA